MADTGFERFGMHPSYATDVVRISGGARLYGGGGFSHTDEGDGWFAQGGFSLTLLNFGRVALVTDNMFRYRDTERAAIYHFASLRGLPIQISAPPGHNCLAWQAAP